MSAGTRHYGAKWWKFDFHNHTPKSDDYGKGPNQAALKARFPREWLLDFMAAGIDCVAITDHNSGEWIDPLKEELVKLDAEKPAGYRPITLFPGVEISVNGGIHILALFDPEVSGSKIIGLLSKCGYEGQPGKMDHCTRSACADVIELIQQKGGIPLLAHADADSGLFKDEKSGVTLKQSLRADGLLAMELIDPSYSLPAVYSELKLRLASVIGSDSHHPTSVGTRYTWVKMESPSLEALRLALHDGEDGVRQLIRKPGEEFANDIYRSIEGGGANGLLAQLIEQTDVPNRWAKLEAIRTVLRDATFADSQGLDRRFSRHLDQLRLNTPEDLDRIAIWTPEDRLKLELVKADGSVEDIETGSAGQRTAGLLGLVLSLDDSPLIIDQPEDDLETRLISSLVVSGLRQLKQDQQVIVVTHNPNIPVNGAAEQIVEMRFATGQIRTGAMGALQRQEIRRAVCEVMEGGKEALDKRYYRISRALS